jgi:hypothetical protein
MHLRSMRTWAQNLFAFYNDLQPPQNIPADFEWLYPQQSPEVMKVLAAFLHKYFNDTAPRHLMLGINPGRFGAGITGVNFTASRQLSEDCSLEHPFKKGSELSAEFIYAMITAFGGVNAFYSRFFIGSVCPLGFVKGGKNINYYDDKNLQAAVEPFIIKSLDTQASFPFKRDKCFCIGGAKNYNYLASLNERHRWFNEIVPLPHPRFIMQYKRKQVPEYIEQYVRLLRG